MRTVDSARACLARGRERLEVADTEGAEHFLRCAIARDSQLAHAYELLGKLLYRDQRSQEAAAVYLSWLQAIPADPGARHLVAATGGAPAPERASAGFIASVFGRAAAEYDTVLHRLGYGVPQLIFEQSVEVTGRGTALGILDLGCGTGLCAERFRGFARRLVGVDLAPEMLDQARRRGCYDELVCAELGYFVQQCTERFDLIMAADVLCYFGDLTAVFAGVARLLRPNGRFVFSVEELCEPEAPAEESVTQPPEARSGSVSLLEHGRYAHSVRYVTQTLTRSDLEPCVVHHEMLRFERGAPVQGLIVTASSTGKDPSLHRVRIRSR